MRYLLMVLCVIGSVLSNAQTTTLYQVENGSISFNSEAPKELISATSKELKGLLDISKRSFVFKIPIASFMGFNNPLQQEHFKENYMETSIFPEAVYKGKIIEDIDLTKDGNYIVRTKGKMGIHGIEHERIIKVDLVVKKGVIEMSSDFTVLLEDHNIKIPRVVFEKLAAEIKVSMKGTLKPKG